MAESVYILCTITSLCCAALLLRSYQKTRVRLILWCGLCFCGLSVNNLLVVLDLVVLRQIDLSAARTASALLAIMIMVFGLVWETGQ